mgnify:CR=1 FL=1
MTELDSTAAPGSVSGPKQADEGTASRGTTASASSSSSASNSSFDRLASLDRSTGVSATATPTRPGTTNRAVRAASMNGAARAAAAPRLTRRGRLRKWDRPKPPTDWRWWVGNLGKTLIAVGLLMFGFVAYQLWGTGIETARAQNQLESEFDAQLAEAPVFDPDFVPGESSSTDPTAGTPTAPDAESPNETSSDLAADSGTAPTEPSSQTPIPISEQNIPMLDNGDALARLEIPRLGRSDIVVAGVETGDLKRGPGHFPDTPLPGQLGNAAIAGHRTTYGAPFFNVDDLQVGDDLITTTLNGTFTYRVTGSEIVSADRYDVVATVDPNRATLTLISCHPKYTAQQRIVIFSELISSESAPVGEPIINYGRPPEPDEIEFASELPAESGQSTGETLPAPGAESEVATGGGTPEGSVTGNLNDITVVDEPSTLEAGQVSNDIVDAFSDGWFSDPGANGQVGMWGALLALVGIAAYAISRKFRRDWAGALIGIMPFVVTLYFFFQNVNRLLPPNL